MQKIVEFSAPRSFWRGQPDLHALNEEVGRLNRDGWRIVQLTPATTLAGGVARWYLLLDDDQQPGDLPVDRA